MHAGGPGRNRWAVCAPYGSSPLPPGCRTRDAMHSRSFPAPPAKGRGSRRSRPPRSLSASYRRCTPRGCTRGRMWRARSHPLRFGAHQTAVVWCRQRMPAASADCRPMPDPGALPAASRIPLGANPRQGRCFSRCERSANRWLPGVLPGMRQGRGRNRWHAFRWRACSAPSPPARCSHAGWFGRAG